jgi:hypothetical protein
VDQLGAATSLQPTGSRGEWYHGRYQPGGTARASSNADGLKPYRPPHPSHMPGQAVLPTGWALPTPTQVVAPPVGTSLHRHQQGHQPFFLPQLLFPLRLGAAPRRAPPSMTHLHLAATAPAVYSRGSMPPSVRYVKPSPQPCRPLLKHTTLG